MSPVSAAWRVCQRLGVDAPVSAAYWRARLAAAGWTYRSRVDAVEVEFVTTTREEYLRAATFLGEEAMLEAMLAGLDGSEVVWDVGANVGLYACFAAAALDDGVVVGLEPEPVNAARLRENLARNAPPARWQTAELALWDRDEPGTLVSEALGVGAGHHYLDADGDGRRVECRRGDTLVADGYPAPDVVKLDVQGAERQVLEGLGDVLDGVGDVYAELHVEKTARYGTTADAVEDYLADAGFALDSLGEPDFARRGVYHVHATRQ